MSRTIFIVLAVVFIALFVAGCGDTTNTVTAPCCDDGCQDYHTHDTDCSTCTWNAPDPVLKTFVWVCKNGKSKKIYEFDLNKYLDKGWKAGKCKNIPPPPPPGDDDDDDDGDNKVCICHIPPGNPDNAHTICIGAPAVDAHIRNHGDYLGECK